MTATSPTVPQPNKEPRTPPGALTKLKKAIMAWARTLHIYTTLLAFLGLLLYAVSGFMLHHKTWFEVMTTSKEDISLPAELVTAKTLNTLQIVERLRSEGHVLGAIEKSERPEDDGFNLEDPSTIIISFRGPSTGSDVTIYRSADADHKVGDTHIEHESRGIMGLLGELHQGKHTGGKWYGWDFVIDLVAITLFFASLSGVLIWSQLSKRRLVGLTCLGAGLLVIVGIYLTMVP